MLTQLMFILLNLNVKWQIFFKRQRKIGIRLFSKRPKLPGLPWEMKTPSSSSSQSRTYIDQTPSMCFTWVRRSLATRLGSKIFFKNTTQIYKATILKIDVLSI